MRSDEPHIPYDRPPLSKQILDGTWEQERLTLRRPADLSSLDLDLRLGVPATGVDLAGRRVHLAGGATVPYEGLIVANGVRPRRLPGVPGAHVLRTLDDALALRDGCCRAGVWWSSVPVSSGRRPPRWPEVSAPRSPCSNRRRCHWPTRSVRTSGGCCLRLIGTTV